MTKDGWSLFMVACLGGGRCEEMWGTVEDGGKRVTVLCERFWNPENFPEPSGDQVFILNDEDLDDYESRFDGPSELLLPMPERPADAAR